MHQKYSTTQHQYVPQSEAENCLFPSPTVLVSFRLSCLLSHSTATTTTTSGDEDLSSDEIHLSLRSTEDETLLQGIRIRNTKNRINAADEPFTMFLLMF